MFSGRASLGPTGSTPPYNTTHAIHQAVWYTQAIIIRGFSLAAVIIIDNEDSRTDPTHHSNSDDTLDVFWRQLPTPPVDCARKLSSVP